MEDKGDDDEAEMTSRREPPFWLVFRCPHPMVVESAITEWVRFLKRPHERSQSLQAFASNVPF